VRALSEGQFQGMRRSGQRLSGFAGGKTHRARDQGEPSGRPSEPGFSEGRFRAGKGRPSGGRPPGSNTHHTPPRRPQRGAPTPHGGGKLTLGKVRGKLDRRWGWGQQGGQPNNAVINHIKPHNGGRSRTKQNGGPFLPVTGTGWVVMARKAISRGRWCGAGGPEGGGAQGAGGGQGGGGSGSGGAPPLRPPARAPRAIG